MWQNRRRSDKFDTLSSNFYLRHNFYNLPDELARQKMCNLQTRSIAQRALLSVKNLHGSVHRLRFSFPITLGQLRYARKTKRHDIIFLIIELFPAVGFSLLKYLIWEKYCNYPLFTTHGDRFTNHEKIVSRSQTPPLFPFLLLNTTCDVRT